MLYDQKDRLSDLARKKVTYMYFRDAVYIVCDFMFATIQSSLYSYLSESNSKYRQEVKNTNYNY